MTIRVNKVPVYPQRLVLLGCIALMAGWLSVVTPASACADIIYIPVADTLTGDQTMSYNLDGLGEDDVFLSNDSTSIGT